MTDDLTPLLRKAWMGDERLPVEAITTIVSAVVETLKTPDLPNIVRLAFGDMRGDLATWLANTFNGNGTIVEVDQLLRQQLLTVAILVSLLRDESGRHADQAALMIKTLSFGGKEPGHPELITAADKHLRWVRDDNATLPTRPRSLGQPAAAKEALEQLGTAEWSVYRTAIIEVSNEIAKVRQALARHSTWVEQREEPMREQLELLWWVTSGVSVSTKRPLKDLLPAAAPVIAGLDVAALAARAPGPPSSSGLLRFALASAGVGTDDSTSLDASKSALEQVITSGTPVPPTSYADFFPVFSHLSGVVNALISPEVSCVALAEETLYESYLYKLMDSFESQ